MVKQLMGWRGIARSPALSNASRGRRRRSLHGLRIYRVERRLRALPGRLAEQRRLGRVAVNYGEARIMRILQACSSYGIPRGTVQYDRCVQNEFAARRPG